MTTDVRRSERKARLRGFLAQLGKAPLVRGFLSLLDALRGLVARATVRVWTGPTLKALAFCLGIASLGMLGHATERRELGERVVLATSSAVTPSTPGGKETPGSPVRPCPSSVGAHPDAATASASAPTEAKIDINVAGPAEWMTLPGVGAKKAAAIIALREKLGRFRKVNDLLRVRGIGAKMLAKWKERLVVGETRSAAK